MEVVPLAAPKTGKTGKGGQLRLEQAHQLYSRCRITNSKKNKFAILKEVNITKETLDQL